MFNLSLTKRYIPAVMLIAIFVIGTNVLSNQMIKANNENAKIINISGKQRMLSQRLIILASNFNLTPNSKTKAEFTNALKEIEEAHKYLLTKVFTPKLQTIYFQEGLNKNLTLFVSYLYKLLQTQDRKYIYKARDNSNTILIQLDHAVKEYEKYANTQLEILSQYEFYLMIATLLMLILEILFIFRPAAQKIDEKAHSLELKEEYESTVIESNNNAIIAIDWTGKITTFNKKAQEIFGYTSSEMINTRNLIKLIPEKYHNAHKNSSKKYLETGVSCGVINATHELEGRRKDGTVFPILISFGAKWKPRDAIIVASIVDISKTKEQEAMIIQQSKMASMGEMLGNIAHQWRQPLSAISSSASGIQLEKQIGVLSDDELNTKLTLIVNKTEYLSQTIEDFRNFFKESKEKENFIVNNIINNVENIISAVYKNNSIILDKDYDTSINIICKGFANELSQVIINILNNAKDILLEKQAKEKLVQISLIQKDSNIIIKIYDNAGGIPTDILPKIFEPYFTTKHQSQGTGIGLYMSSEIISSHFNGTLKAFNKEFTLNGKKHFGACFEITIPSNINDLTIL